LQKIQRLKPASLFWLLPPQLVVAYVFNVISYYIGLGGVREAVGLVGEVGFFALSIPIMAVVSILALVGFAAVYNSYNANRPGLEVQLIEELDGAATHRLARLEPGSVTKAFVPILAASLILIVISTGLTFLIAADQIGGALLPGDALIQMFVMTVIVGTPIVAGLVLVLYMLAAAVYNKVSTGGDGLRLTLSADEEALFKLNRVHLGSLHYLLPSIIALQVIVTLFNMLVGSLNNTGVGVFDTLWIVGWSIPALYLSFFVYNLLCRRSGVAFELRDVRDNVSTDLLNR